MAGQHQSAANCHQYGHHTSNPHPQPLAPGPRLRNTVSSMTQSKNRHYLHVHPTAELVAKQHLRCLRSRQLCALSLRAVQGTIALLPNYRKGLIRHLHSRLLRRVFLCLCFRHPEEARWMLMQRVSRAGRDRLVRARLDRLYLLEEVPHREICWMMRTKGV